MLGIYRTIQLSEIPRFSKNRILLQVVVRVREKSLLRTEIIILCVAES